MFAQINHMAMISPQYPLLQKYYQSLFHLKPKRALPYFYEQLLAKELSYRAAAAGAIGDIVAKGDQTALKALRGVIEKSGEAEMVVQAAKKAYNKVAGGEVYPVD